MNEATRPRSEPLPVGAVCVECACRRSSSTSSAVGANGSAATLPSASVQRGAGDAVDLGDEGGAGERLAAVEDREVCEGAGVGVGGAAYDDRAGACGGGHDGAPSEVRWSNAI